MHKKLRVILFGVVSLSSLVFALSTVPPVFAQQDTCRLFLLPPYLVPHPEKGAEIGAKGSIACYWKSNVKEVRVTTIIEMLSGKDWNAVSVDQLEIPGSSAEAQPSTSCAPGGEPRIYQTQVRGAYRIGDQWFDIGPSFSNPVRISCR